MGTISRSQRGGQARFWCRPNALRDPGSATSAARRHAVIASASSHFSASPFRSTQPRVERLGCATIGRVGVNAPKSPVTKGSNGIAMATVPNVCKMPGPPLRSCRPHSPTHPVVGVCFCVLRPQGDVQRSCSAPTGRRAQPTHALRPWSSQSPIPTRRPGRDRARRFLRLSLPTHRVVQRHGGAGGAVTTRRSRAHRGPRRSPRSVGCGPLLRQRRGLRPRRQLRLPGRDGDRRHQPEPRGLTVRRAEVPHMLMQRLDRTFRILTPGCGTG